MNRIYAHECQCAIESKKKNFTTKNTKSTKRERKKHFFQAFAPCCFFVFFVSSWFYFLEVYNPVNRVNPV